MKKLILRNQLSPGDIVMLTAAVRDLHRCYPGEFLTDVRTSCMQLWDHNPHITPLSEDDPDVQTLDCSYPLINSSNVLPYHCLHGFIAFLNEQLGLSIKPTAFRGDIHLSPQEKSWFSQVHELADCDLPFWIVAAGGKYDITIKWWSTQRYQEVIDSFRDRIQFVQVGAAGHYHPRLDGVIDLRGKTDLRQLVRLIYHSQAVLCGVTAAMHLAAAIETKPGASPSRPCVVVAGGREPAHWEAYPDHQFISTNGALPCCTRGGCWRARTFPLSDGDDRDNHLCIDVVENLPRCMDMITAQEVSRRIDFYLQGGAILPLTTEQRAHARTAVARSNRNHYDESAITVHNARIALEAFLKQMPAPPTHYSGRGIVICGGGLRYFTNAWVGINILRQIGCKLPIELWHLGPDEMDDTMRALVEPFNVECVDAQEVAKTHPVRRLGGWQSKPFAILHSRFREVLFLDADNVPLVDPEFLFETPQYQKSGAIFWPDFPSTSEEPEVAWKVCGLERPGPDEFESGQIVVDKARCWAALRLALWFNEHSDFFYKHVHGDKETFHLAFHKLRQPYGYVPIPIEPLPATMCQHDFQGRRIFQHRNLDKWSLLRNRHIAGFQFEEDCRRYIHELREKWDGGLSKYLTADQLHPTAGLRTLRFEACIISCASRKESLEQTLASLRQSDWGTRPIHVQLDSSRESCPKIRQTQTAFLALEAMLRTPATHVLFFEDDLNFNRHLVHNLMSWRPLTASFGMFASLYNPGMHMLACSHAHNFYIAPANTCFGSQAFVISREALKSVLERWNDVSGMQDIRISRLLAKLQPRMFYHSPSLVQHVGKESTWGGSFHQACDFDPDWKVGE